MNKQKNFKPAILLKTRFNLFITEDIRRRARVMAAQDGLSPSIFFTKLIQEEEARREKS